MAEGRQQWRWRGRAAGAHVGVAVAGGAGAGADLLNPWVGVPLAAVGALNDGAVDPAGRFLAGTIAAYADGSVDPRPPVAATVGLDEVAEVFAGHRPADAGPGPKIHVDPRR
ncbi:hypothetical protein AB0J72_33180 [Dactylosporangium sp. NPDC049742]|uniref:hypothetical protein n=1 Tax=Dactylosporangium sp. NPDC049742 TaxID=3154737 RepID=UPI00343BFA13